jgi:phage host-nuclease inhibitor protein Gam
VVNVTRQPSTAFRNPTPTIESETDLDELAEKMRTLKLQVDAIAQDFDDRMRPLERVRQLADEEIAQLLADKVAALDGPNDALKDMVAAAYQFLEKDGDEHWKRLRGRLTYVKRAIASFHRNKGPSPRIEIEDEDSVVKSLKELGLDRFLKEIPNRTAMAADQTVAENITGIRFVRSPTFIVKLVGDLKLSYQVRELRERLARNK